MAMGGHWALDLDVAGAVSCQGVQEARGWEMGMGAHLVYMLMVMVTGEGSSAVVVGGCHGWWWWLRNRVVSCC